MARNGAGTYTLPAGNPVVTGTTISSTWANNTLSDIGGALTQSIAKDGQTVPTANLPMGGFKHTGLAAGTNAGDSLRFEQLFSQGAPTDVASASTVDIGAQNTCFLNITDNTTITSFGTNYNGPRYVKFVSSLTINYNATTLITPTLANFTVSAGSYALIVPKSTTSGTPDGWQILAYYNGTTIDMTGYSGADIVANIGDKLSYTLSGTNSLPLRIATGNNQIYRLYWTGKASGGASTNQWTFSINNTTYAGTIYWLTTYGNSNTGNQVVSGLTQGLMTLAIAGDLKVADILFFTQTDSKRGIMTNAKCGGVAGANYIVNSTFESTDTTTAWTSLGTLASADSMVGTLIVERIA